jgi:hypothetical protein
MAHGGNSGRAVDLVSDKTRRLFGGFAGVDPHSNTKLLVTGPREIVQSTLNINSTGNGGPWGGECRKERVAQRSLFATSMSLYRFTDDPVVLGQDGREGDVTQAAKHGRGAFNICGEEGQSLDK